MKCQSSSFHSEGDVETPTTMAIQEHAAIDQGVVVSQEERIFNRDNSTDEAEEMVCNTNDVKRTETGLYRRDVFCSMSRLQEIYGDFSEIPKSHIESEDKTQECGGQSFLPHLQQQYGAEEVGQRQTTEFYGTKSEADCLQFPAVSITTYSEDRGKYELISRDTLQQRMSQSQFAEHGVSQIISTDIAVVSQPSSITKSSSGSTGSKPTRTAYTSAQLREMEQEFRNNRYLYRPRRVSLATLLNLSKRKVKIWFRNKKKKKKKKKKKC
jgi:hypothetical protein